jgi:hypothetical protein
MISIHLTRPLLPELVMTLAWFYKDIAPMVLGLEENILAQFYIKWQKWRL